MELYVQANLRNKLDDARLLGATPLQIRPDAWRKEPPSTNVQINWALLNKTDNDHTLECVP